MKCAKNQAVSGQDSPEVIEPYTLSGYILFDEVYNSFVSSPFLQLSVINTWRTDSIRLVPSRQTRCSSPRFARRIVLVFPLAVSARANDKLCTRICIFDTWLQRPRRNALALSYVTGPVANSAQDSCLPCSLVVFLFTHFLVSFFSVFFSVIAVSSFSYI